MHLNPTAAVRLGGVFHRLVNNLYPRSHRHVIKQVFNIVVTQADTALTHAQANTEIRIGAMNGIKPPNIDGIQPHRVIRPGRHKSGQAFAALRIFATGIRRRRPARPLLFTFNRRHPVSRRFTSSLTNADRQYFNSIAARWIIIKPHFGNVHYDPLPYSVR